MSYNKFVEGMAKSATALILALFFLGMIFLSVAFAKWAFFLLVK